MNPILHATLFYGAAALLALLLWAVPVYGMCDRPRKRHFWHNYLYTLALTFLITAGSTITVAIVFAIV